MQCSKCQFENPEGIKFCVECGNKLEAICAKCGFSNSPSFKFCGECGHSLTISSEPPPKEFSFDDKLDKIQKYLPKGLTEKILAQRDRIEGERKQVTVMFCDMEGFTRLAERIGPEEAFTIIDKVYEILIHKVYDYGGTVNELTGDGIMALFGAPIALEDAPQRAIRSSLAVHREMAKFSDRLKQEKELISPLKMRIGIHTGPVVVGTLGNDLRVEFKAVGDTVNLASRVEGLAEPGTTSITEATFNLTEGFFRFEALGEREVKGKEEPVQIYRAIASSTSRTKFDVSTARGLTPFVGRDRELELLLDSFERVKAGRGQAVSVVAEAGVGKSRLLYEFRKAVANVDVTFLEGRCLSYSRGVPYHLHIDILKANFDIREGDGESEIRKKVERGLKIIRVDEASTLPYLLELLGVKDSGIDKVPLSPEAKKGLIFEALKRITLKASEIRPLILSYEDLHWMEKSSEDVLKNALESIPGARILMIFTYRPEFVHSWGGRSYHNQVNLNRLSNRESLTMVTYLLGTEVIDNSLEELILEKTEGVPFFIEEFIKSLTDLNIIEKKDSKYRLSKDIKEVAIPSTIQDVTMARVDLLPDAAKEVLKTGSVIGREFSYELIKMVSELAQEELLSYLSVLKDSELLYERGIFPQSAYIFKHALTQEVVYSSLLLKRRKQIHEKIAKAMEELHPERLEEFYEMLAYHYTEAGCHEQAIPYWQRAGQRALQRSASVEALDHLNKGLEGLKTLPDTPVRTQLELDFLIALGLAYRLTRGYTAPEVARTYGRARAVCQQVGDTPKLGQVLFGLSMYHLGRADYRTAQELGRQLLAEARRQKDIGLILEAHRMLGSSLYYSGEFSAARTHLERGIALYDPQQHRSHAALFGFDPGVVCHALAANALSILGYPDQAQQRIQTALTLAQATSHPHSLGAALNWTVELHQHCGERQVVQEHAERSLAFSTDQGFPHWVAWATHNRGWALAMQGRSKEGIAQLHHGRDMLQDLGLELAMTGILGNIAEAYGHARQPEAGLQAMAEALKLMEQKGERRYEASLYRIKGELLLGLSADHRTEAETCFHQALDVARRQQAKLLELGAAASLSRLWQQQSKRQEARELLAEIYGWFTEGFDTRFLKEVKALLEELM
jgi:class 3 adenylate cyclase/predicted ATPase